MLSGVGIPPGHYTHIFVDEAGQATEPEVMISVATLAGCDLTNVVLSGDPKQLGPIIRSSVARVLGLEKSYLERIMEREGYDEDAGPHESYVHFPPLLFRHDNFFLAFSGWSN
jgi:helicase MOV-10